MKCHADCVSSITGETQNLEPRDLSLDSSADKRRAYFNHDIQRNAWGLRRVAWKYSRYSSQRFKSFDSVQQKYFFIDFFCGLHYYTSRWRVNQCFIHSKNIKQMHLLMDSWNCLSTIYICLYEFTFVFTGFEFYE